jgi:2-C-methyl-D-erythritol 4-phosphate cytidylyltransferase/2-C-methyl-D-erythritol 2,4-cyclodiphosphate synthase
LPPNVPNALHSSDTAAASVDAIVVAAGSSSRMGGIDKLEADIAGRPLLAWTLDAIAGPAIVRRIVVVAAPDRVETVAGSDWLPGKVAAVVPGGRKRHESVAAGVGALERMTGADDPVVLVHDGARPLVSHGLIERVAAAAAVSGAAIPVLPIAETVKVVAGGQIEATLDRSGLGLAQTPQAMRLSLLRRAFDEHPAVDEHGWTDESALLEAARIPVRAIEGEPLNLKVTLPADLLRATQLLSGPSTPRVGFGIDSHPFGAGSPLALGGIELSEAPRLHGHSDGDVALHAVADALLGAAGLGDLGRLFPSGAGTPEGVASARLLADVVARVRATRAEIRSVDLTIVGARPRLADRLDAMRDAIAAIAGVPPAAVNVKASTGNLSGMEGAGRGMTAHAIVSIVEFAVPPGDEAP